MTAYAADNSASTVGLHPAIADSTRSSCQSRRSLMTGRLRNDLRPRAALRLDASYTLNLNSTTSPSAIT